MSDDLPRCGSTDTVSGEPCRYPLGHGTTHAGKGSCYLHGGEPRRIVKRAGRNKGDEPWNKGKKLPPEQRGGKKPLVNREQLLSLIYSTGGIPRLIAQQLSVKMAKQLRGRRVKPAQVRKWIEYWSLEEDCTNALELAIDIGEGELFRLVRKRTIEKVEREECPQCGYANARKIHEVDSPAAQLRSIKFLLENRARERGYGRQEQGLDPFLVREAFRRLADIIALHADGDVCRKIMHDLGKLLMTGRNPIVDNPRDLPTVQVIGGDEGDGS